MFSNSFPHQILCAFLSCPILGGYSTHVACTFHYLSKNGCSLISHWAPRFKTHDVRKLWQQAVVAYMKALSKHFAEENGENFRGGLGHPEYEGGWNHCSKFCDVNTFKIEFDKSHHVYTTIIRTNPIPFFVAKVLSASLLVKSCETRLCAARKASM